jgi:D-glycero-D-manno-heptose 1,7-bisphosphate phosphatase
MVIKKKPTVFLDRDGVLIESKIENGKPIAISHHGEVKILSGVIEAIALLMEADYELVVVTNQPDISRGCLSWMELENIHKEISRSTRLQAFYVCPHADSDSCMCRKPMPGLLLRAAKDLDLDLGKSYLVGDRWRDIEAGQAVGCSCFFIDYNYAEREPAHPFRQVESLLHAAKIILSERNLVE